MHQAATALAALSHLRDHDAPPSAGPRAIGALTFEGGSDLVLPSRIVARDADGRTWRTTIAGADIPSALHVPHAPPTQFTVRSLVEAGEWRARVEQSLAAIAAGEIDKVVLAREVDIEADAPFDIVDVLDTLRATQPGCTVYATDGFVGASPELLVRRRGRDVFSRPMAGTGADPSALLASAKDAHEHRIVVDAIAAALPGRVRVRQLRRARGDAVRDRHPPRDDDSRSPRRRRRSRHRHGSREAAPSDPGGRRMAGRARAHDDPHARRPRPRPVRGPCGWVDGAGDGEFVVALRGAQIDGPNARLYAGAGIVAGSEPGAEWAETQAKLAADAPRARSPLATTPRAPTAAATADHSSR